MPYAQCPKCGDSVKVSANDSRTSVRCLKCGHRVGISKLGKATVAAPTRGGRTVDERYAWLAVVGAVPLGLLFLFLSFRFDLFGFLAPSYAAALFAFAFIWGTIYASRDGAHVGYAWMDSSTLRFILMLFGPYWAGYFLYLLFTQFQYASRDPKKYLPVFTLGATGFALLTCCPVSSAFREHANYVRWQERRARGEVDVQLPPVDPEAKKKYGDAEVDQALADLRSGDAAARAAAGDRLAGMTPTKNRSAVATALANGYRNAGQTENRKAYWRPLIRWATPEQSLLVSSMLRDREIPLAVRSAALQALGALADAGTIPDIVEAYRDPEMKTQVVSALKAMGPVGEEGLHVRFGQPGPGGPLLLVEILKEVGTEKSIPVLQRERMRALNGNNRAFIDEALATILARSKK